MDLGCTGRKDGQTDSTRTREKKERQTEPSCRALLAGSRKAHSEHTLSAHRWLLRRQKGDRSLLQTTETIVTKTNI